jgi:glycine cleavage system aminomethyltransferase T
VGRDDQRYLLSAEGPSGDALEQWLEQHAAGPELQLERLDRTHRLFSLHGPWAWELLSACLGPDVVGMPYLTLMRGGGGLICLRTGKTGEYGYELLVPNEGFAALHEGLVQAGRDWELQRVSQGTLDHCALENWFFSIRHEGRFALSPLELGLQWRLSPKKKEYVGAAALAGRRASARVTCVVADGPVAEGDEVSFEGRVIGRVLHAVKSPVVQGWVASTLLELPLAVPGIWGLTAGGHAARTSSPPVLNNRSLYVSPQRHTWADRSSPQFPPLALPA